MKNCLLIPFAFNSIELFALGTIMAVYKPLKYFPFNEKQQRMFFYVPFRGPEFTILTLHTYLSASLSILVQRIWLSVKNFNLHVTVLMIIFVPTAVS